MKQIIINIYNHVKAHLPLYIGAALIIVNALIDNNLITLSDPMTNTVNAVLAALGLGILHHRQAVITTK